MKTELRKREEIPPIEAHRVEEASDSAKWPDAQLGNALKAIFPPITDIVGTIKKLRGKDLYLLAPGVAKKPLSHLPPLAPKPLTPAITAPASSLSGGGGGGGNSSDPRVYVPTEQEEKELIRKIELSEKSPPRPFGSMPEKAVNAPAPDIVSERREIARNYYKSETNWSDTEIDQHMRGIDFNREVEVVTLKKGRPVQQHTMTGSQGNYYSDPGSSPSELGISPYGRDRSTGELVPKKTSPYCVTEDVPVLKSTAAPIKDTWSAPPDVFETQGGQTQYFCPKKSNFA